MELIDRTKLEPHQIYDEDGWVEVVYMDDIREMPTIEAEMKWIPVTERLPEEAGTYLVTLEYKEHGTGITTLWFHGSLGWDMRVADVVTAWMPLPEPYKMDEVEK